MKRSNVLPVLLLVAGACSDAIPSGPSPVALPGSSPATTVYDGSVPYFTNPGDVENIIARIYSATPVVYWDRSTAVFSSSMFYYGNRAEETLQLTISGPTSLSHTLQSSSSQFWFGNYTHETAGIHKTAGACGHHAEIRGQHRAKASWFVEYRGFGFTAAEVSRYDEASQLDCGMEEDDSPYSPEGGSSGGGDTGCPECLEEPAQGYTMCRVRYWYYVDTGEIFDAQILYCW